MIISTLLLWYLNNTFLIHWAPICNSSIIIYTSHFIEFKPNMQYYYYPFILFEKGYKKWFNFLLKKCSSFVPTFSTWKMLNKEHQLFFTSCFSFLH
jgi:hypothetical protein